MSTKKRNLRVKKEEKVTNTKLAAKRKGYTPFVHPRGKRYMVLTTKGKKVLRWEDELEN